MENDETTRDALLRSAISVFAEKGFQAATVRDICQCAKANVAAVSYHFGGKEALYCAVLELISQTSLEARAKRKSHSLDNPTPEERLREYIRDAVAEVYGCKDDESWRGELGTIFILEMARPSNHLDTLVEHYIRPNSEELYGILREILGPGAPDELVFACSGTIWGQITHPLFTQPVLDRLRPEKSGSSVEVEPFADHISSFTLGGLEAIRNSLSKTEGGRNGQQ